MSSGTASRPIHLKLPATSANLGPGFDALGLALSLYLTIDAEASRSGEFSISATGRDRELCGNLKGNLILDTYKDVIVQASGTPVPLSLVLHNEIPLGMGCGSSAAALLAGVLLANHFGDLGWTGDDAMQEACRREGHPDNVAACWFGGMTVSAITENEERSTVVAASCGEDVKWRFILVVPSEGLVTKEARAMLPDSYGRADAVLNVQHTALLVAAFALERGDLLRTAMTDRLHQPYRMAACPLLPLLLPLVDMPGVLGVALSGAGPSVLLVCASDADMVEIRTMIQDCAGDVEVTETKTSKGTITLVT